MSDRCPTDCVCNDGGCPPIPAPTITRGMVRLTDCPHCQARTVHVISDGKRVCLQCAADGGTPCGMEHDGAKCSPLSAFNRWVPKETTR